MAACAGAGRVGWVRLLRAAWGDSDADYCQRRRTEDSICISGLRYVWCKLARPSAAVLMCLLRCPCCACCASVQMTWWRSASWPSPSTAARPSGGGTRCGTWTACTHGCWSWVRGRMHACLPAGLDAMSLPCPQGRLPCAVQAALSCLAQCSTQSLFLPAQLPLAGGELSDRLLEDREANNRVPQLLTVTISTQLPWAVGQQGAVQAAHGGRRGSGCFLPARLHITALLQFVCRLQLVCSRVCHSAAHQLAMRTLETPSCCPLQTTTPRLAPAPCASCQPPR